MITIDFCILIFAVLVRYVNGSAASECRYTFADDTNDVRNISVSTLLDTLKDEFEAGASNNSRFKILQQQTYHLQIISSGQF